MTKSEVPHPILAIVVAVLLFGGVGYGIYYHSTEGKEQSREVEQELFEPYFRAIEAGKIDEAWERYTTPHYKETFSIDAYRARWQTISSNEKFDREQLTVNASYDAIHRYDYLLVSYGFTLDHDYAHVFYRVVRDADGTLRIHESGRSYSGHPRLDPEPW